MGLWANSQISTNETAMVFNQLANLKAIPMIRKKHGLLYAVLGKQEVGSTPGAEAGFERMEKITGKKVEVKLLGKLPAVTTVADGSSEVSTVSLSYASDYFGGAEFPLTHYQYTHPIPHSELDRFKGSEAKTASYLNEVFDMIMLAYEKEWGAQLAALNDCSRTQLGGYGWAIGGNNSGAANWAANGGSYGTIDRTDSGNADFRGNYTYLNRDLRLTDVDSEQATTWSNGGDLKLGVCSATVYNKLRQLTQAYAEVTYNKDWAEFGSTHIRYGGIAFTLDPDCASGTLALFTPETWMFYKSSQSEFTKGVVNDVSRRSTYVVPTEYWIQLICKRPNHNNLITAITG